MLIHESMIAIMRDIDAIAKGRSNDTQHYKFRGIDDVYSALHDILAKHGVFTLPEVIEDRAEERLTKSGGNLIYRVLKIRYHFIAIDGSEVVSTVIGEGMDSGDKASNKAMSVAHKYSLLQAFCIPTEDPKDPENDNPEPLPRHETISVQAKCTELSKELHKTDEEKAAMWKACGMNYSNLLILLEAELAARITDKLEGATK